MTEVFNHAERKQLQQMLRRNAPDTEIMLWSRLQQSQLGGYKFRRQASVDRYVVDFYCPRERLVVEIDGDSHFNDEAERYDMVRTDFLKSLGLKVLRFTNEDVRQRQDEVLEEILRTLKTTPTQ